MYEYYGLIEELPSGAPSTVALTATLKGIAAAHAAPTGKLPLSATATSAGKSISALSGKVPLTATAKTMGATRGALIATSNLVALLAAGAGQFKGRGSLTGAVPLSARSGAQGKSANTLSSKATLAAVLGGRGNARGSLTGALIPPFRFAFKNIFAQPLYQPFTGLAPPIAASSLVKVYANEPANLFLAFIPPFISPPEFISTSVLTFIRPDGSSYAVPNISPYVAVLASGGTNYVYYRTGVDELNQSGWWQVAIESKGLAPFGYIFYVWSNPQPPFAYPYQ